MRSTPGLLYSICVLYPNPMTSIGQVAYIHSSQVPSLASCLVACLAPISIGRIPPLLIKTITVVFKLNPHIARLSTGPTREDHHMIIHVCLIGSRSWKSTFCSGRKPLPSHPPVCVVQNGWRSSRTDPGAH
ncbi:hypothetical protein [Phaffia rhodozyma]|uniref:Uncharacterized protein n=1 Tax=Phaffia rhodozyma TaxID=264483 RepID=A0A0F7SES2_PHARH|nr:hypothetical protein [Phaffia rhodozyma]